MEQAQEEAKKKAVDDKTNMFYEKIGFSSDLGDQLQDLANYL